MKITTETNTTTTTIEATAEELRQSTTLGDGLTRLLRNFFNGATYSNTQETKSEEEEEEGTE